MIAGLFLLFSVLAALSALFRRSPVRRWFATRQHRARALSVVGVLWLVAFVVLTATTTPAPRGVATTADTKRAPEATHTKTTAPATTTAAPRPKPARPAPDTRAIQRVVDGDTVVLDDGRRVRLLGVNAPERASACGPDATTFLGRYLYTRVAVVPDPTQAATDRYGRTLVYLIAPDGTDLSVALARNGWARYYDVGRDVMKAGAIRAAVASARAKAAGTWSATGCAAPAPTTTVAPEPTTEEPTYTDPETYVDEPDTYVDVPDVPDVPDVSGHTGDTGHPCLPGERDGDGDGFCGEG